ncbi:MAG: hypothetical protein OEV29_13050 [Thermoleophilia bacterium]|nr:hypothetical protein [Thermoleophilia bacterium]
MTRHRTSRSNMTETELRSSVEAMPGEWDVRPVMGQHIRLRWVAEREKPETDNETGETSTARQFESSVDAEDLIERLHRRNVSLGIESGGSRREVAQRA